MFLFVSIKYKENPVSGGYWLVTSFYQLQVKAASVGSVAGDEICKLLHPGVTGPRWDARLDLGAGCFSAYSRLYQSYAL